MSLQNCHLLRLVQMNPALLLHSLVVKYQSLVTNICLILLPYKIKLSLNMLNLRDYVSDLFAIFFRQ